MLLAFAFAFIAGTQPSDQPTTKDSVLVPLRDTPPIAPEVPLMAEPASVGPFEISARGFIQNDFRVVVVGKPGNGEVAGQYIRNQAQIMGRLTISAWDKITAVVQARPIYTGIAQISNFSDLLDRTKIDPMWIELDDTYVEVTNVFTRGLDFKLGRQFVQWGTSDLFNPTNVVNSRDFYDPLQFGRPVANEMALVRYQTPVDLSFTAVYIPVFRPARLPPEATAAFNSGATVTDPKDRLALTQLQNFQNQFTQFGPITNTINPPTPQLPPVTLQNGMAAFKAKGSLAGVDFSASYVYGRWDLPVPLSANAQSTVNYDSVTGLPTGVAGNTNITLIYPRYHMVGADFSTSLDRLGGLGLWAEGGLFIPQAVNFTIDYTGTGGALLKSLYPRPLPCAGPSCAIVHSNPFVKMSAGFDYTLFSGHLYVNLQYLYGFIDEFGAGTEHHYGVTSIDIKPFGDQYTLRLAGVFNFNDYSYVGFPAFIFKPYPGFEIYLGALVFSSYGKFGAPQNGNTQIFCRARFSF